MKFLGERILKNHVEYTEIDKNGVGQILDMEKLYNYTNLNNKIKIKR